MARRAMGWILLIGIALALGLAARTYRLDARGMTHPEFYVARLPVPDYVVHPPVRDTLAHTIDSVWQRSDIHPPGFYLISWAWNGVLGTGLVAIRMLSVLAGMLTVAMFARVVWRSDGPAVAAVAASALALHGFHVLKSSEAQLWVFPTLFGLASVALLRRLLVRFSAPTALAYVALLTAGLWTEYSFWIFCAAQAVYTALHLARAGRGPRLLGLQMLAAAMSLSVFIYLRQDLHSENRTRYLESRILPYLAEVLRFGNLVDLEALQRIAPPGVAAALLWGVTALGAAMLVLGFARTRAPAAPEPASEGAAPWLACLAAGTLATLALAGHAWTLPIGWKFPLGLAAAAWAFCAAAALLAPAWRRIAPALASVAAVPAWSAALLDEATYFAAAPVAAICGVAMVTPILGSRVLMIATPFVLWVCARAICSIRMPAVRAALLASLAALCVLSVVEYEERPRSRRDYQGLRLAMDPLMRPDDVIVFRNEWWAAPMHYYLPPGRFTVLRPEDLDAYVATGARHRIWAVLFGGPQDPKVGAQMDAIASRLPGYETLSRVTAQNGEARLLAPPGAAERPK